MYQLRNFHLSRTEKGITQLTLPFTLAGGTISTNHVETTYNGRELSTLQLVKDVDPNLPPTICNVLANGVITAFQSYLKTAAKYVTVVCEVGIGCSFLVKHVTNFQRARPRWAKFHNPIITLLDMPRGRNPRFELSKDVARILRHGTTNARRPF